MAWVPPVQPVQVGILGLIFRRPGKGGFAKNRRNFRQSCISSRGLVLTIWAFLPLHGDNTYHHMHLTSVAHPTNPAAHALFVCPFHRAASVTSKRGPMTRTQRRSFPMPPALLLLTPLRSRLW